ncbi:efflux RND transporter periplasmic adaptor subunit [Mucilaginibacter sp. ZT4R22]|uniref:Efflux RND transporter periplasmic adaptor subunit n=1 Tax=Mucilaginibacter pankratovii TaxID=2772110 RepID=A0ABR7WSX8_9SPHI|nr:efflux RND transporter periplasmic adaptor subunit [Mucilaginibacter pankratovii]MBD1365408.1 efflux RND transporter periplasmic adaptor subunit [Mucilaginibacter pankratovii]
MRQNKKLIQTLIFPAFLPLFLLFSCKTKDKHATQNAPLSTAVETEVVHPDTIAKEVSVSGNIEGNTTVRLSFMVGGKINYISNKEGENITKGQMIASLDPTNYSIAKGTADVQVSTATDEFNRLNILHDRGSLSESDFSKVGFNLQQAKLQQRLQQKNLSDTRLYSPISGVLLKKQTEIGEIVGVGTPLFVIADIRKVKVLAYVPESELHEVKIGQISKINISSLDKVFTGKVIEVGSAADATSRAFTIKIELDNPASLIRPGMIAEAKIATTEKKQMILLPAECVQQDLANQSYVFVLDKTQNKVFKRRISLGNMFNNKIEIISGLINGEVVVTSGQKRLSDGSSISITNK